jgi:hypothetical protein
MEIELRYPCDDGEMNRKVTLPDGTDASKLCRRLGVDNIALYDRDGLGGGGRVVGEYINKGPLKPGIYTILNFDGGEEAGMARLGGFVWRGGLGGFLRKIGGRPC